MIYLGALIAHQSLALETRATPAAQVQPAAATGWRLGIPTGSGEVYRWAQLDDYLSRRRSRFLWQAPCRLSLRGRVSSAEIAGTWGFGFWNDPFNLSLGLGGSVRRFPALPNTAWFFYASPPNYLSLRDDQPAQGFLAATFGRHYCPRHCWHWGRLFYLYWVGRGRRAGCARWVAGSCSKTQRSYLLIQWIGIAMSWNGKSSGYASW